MEKPVTVILWGREDTIGQGVGLLLNAQKGWDVIRIDEKQSIDYVIREVERVKPDAVIINQSDCTGDMSLPIQMLDEYPEVRVITFNLRTSALEVFYKQRVWVKNIADLLAAVEG